MDVDSAMPSQNRAGCKNDPDDISNEVVSHTVDAVDVAYKYKLNGRKSKQEDPGR
jgi:hypothetical protein